MSFDCLVLGLFSLLQNTDSLEAFALLYRNGIRMYPAFALLYRNGIRMYPAFTLLYRNRIRMYPAFALLYRNRIRMYPAFVNCTTIDWFSEWPADALLEVADKYLMEVQIGGDDEVRVTVLLTYWSKSNLIIPFFLGFEVINRIRAP